MRRILAIFRAMLLMWGVAFLSNTANCHEDHGVLKGHAFFGIVLSSDGFPVADAAVTFKAAELSLGQLQQTPETLSMTDAEGRFWMEGLSEGEHQIIVSVPYIVDQTFSAFVGLKEAELEEFKLKDAYFITGHITDHQGLSEPSAKVHVSFSPKPADNIRLIQKTDEDGYFSIGPFPTGLRVHLGGQDSEGISSISLPVFPGKHDLTVRLPKRVRIVGTVLDAQSKTRINTFTLWIHPFEDGSRGFEHVNTQGKLSANAVGSNINLIVDAPEYFPKYLGRFAFYSNDEYDLGSVRLEKGKTLGGRVYDEDTQLPIEGAKIVLTAATSTESLPSYGETIKTSFLMRRVKTKSRANGMYSLAPLPSEPRVIEIEANGYLWGEVLVDGTVTKLDIPLQKRAKTNTRVFGQLMTTSGDPIEGLVSVFDIEKNSGRSYSTDFEGKFDIETGIGRQEISAWSTYGDSEEIDLNLKNGESRELLFEFDPSGRLMGVIEGLIGAETVDLQISRSEYDRVQSDLYVKNGEYQFEGLGTGRFRVTAETSMNRKLIKTFELKDNVSKARANFDFSGRSRLHGSVVAADGANVTYVVKAIPNDPSHTTGWCETYNDRSFEIHGLNDGKYTVETWRIEDMGNRSRTSQESSTFVQISGDTKLDVQLSKIVMKGTIHPEEAWANARIELERTSDEDYTAYIGKVNRKGQFRFTGLRPGSYTLWVTHEDFEPHRQHISIAGSIGDLRVTLSPRPAGTLKLDGAQQPAKESLDTTIRLEPSPDGVSVGSSK